MLIRHTQPDSEQSSDEERMPVVTHCLSLATIHDHDKHLTYVSESQANRKLGSTFTGWHVAIFNFLHIKFRRGGGGGSDLELN